MVQGPFGIKIEDQDFGKSSELMITSMALSHSEDYLNLITKNNQLIRCKLPSSEDSNFKPKFKFVHCQNHTQEITGLDVCIRRELIATCSTDQTIKIWNYANKSL